MFIASFIVYGIIYLLAKGYENMNDEICGNYQEEWRKEYLEEQKIKREKWFKEIDKMVEKFKKEGIYGKKNIGDDK